ncbi:hypothetical protein WJX84_001616 [Apatococcus fuscideae]|uniref:PsbP C-terminal domain-containing protein n=1 Tax=Apatococcus fuscideae TaxID=2026836 RepID=A0AAW1T7Q4_9CHLO
MLSILQTSSWVSSSKSPCLQPRRPDTPYVRCQSAPEPRAGHSQADSSEGLGRRAVLSAAAACLAAAPHLPAEAIQGSTAGRLPGLGKPDEDGYRVYTRPQGKSGGHGIGWTEIPTYSFRVPTGWKEVPVSIADLGGTEIDVRFGNPEAGALQIVVAPVARFVDIDDNADVRIQDLGPPEKIISGFNPEIYGGPLNEDDVLSQETEEVNGITYYRWELRPHHLVTATAYKNRVFLLGMTANGRQWRKNEPSLKEIARSLQVPVPSAG